MVIDLICQTKSESDLFCIPENERLKPVFEYKITFFSSAVNLQRLLCSQKAGVKCSY